MSSEIIEILDQELDLVSGGKSLWSYALAIWDAGSDFVGGFEQGFADGAAGAGKK